MYASSERSGEAVRMCRFTSALAAHPAAIRKSLVLAQLSSAATYAWCHIGSSGQLLHS